MGFVKITCATCEHFWKVSGNASVYERQTLESTPCPKCGAYTLCCGPATEMPTRLALSLRRRLRGALMVRRVEATAPNPA